MMERNHYQVLMLEPTASREEIAPALRRLSDQAALLAYAAPQRSHELWERIRQIREDLLLDPERRAAYDRSLFAAREAVSASAERVAAPPSARIRERQPAPRRRAFVGQTLGSAAVLAAAVALFVVLGHRARTSRPPGPLALALSSTGLQHRYQYVSGQMVHLRWSAVPHALVYRVQVAAGRHISKNLAVFRLPILTRLSLGTTYALKVVGPQVYYWRIQAYVRDRWTPYSHAQQFVVARPTVIVPAPRAPAVRIARGPTPRSSHPVVAAVVRRSPVRIAARSGGRTVPTPESHQAAQTVRQVAALVSAPPTRVPRPASPSTPRIDVRPTVSTVRVRAAPRPPAPTPVMPPAPRPPISSPAATSAPRPPAPPVPPPRPPASPTLLPRPAATQPPVGTVTYPVSNAVVSPVAVPRSPAPLEVPVAVPAGTPVRGKVSSAPQRPVSSPVPAPPTPSPPSWSPWPKHHLISAPQGPVAPEASTQSSDQD